MADSLNNAKAGDKVRIVTNDDTFEGILMPRPELYDDDITVLKIKSGYNIGISKEKIKLIEVIKHYELPKLKEHKVENNPNLPTVCIISSGGTISSKVDYTTGGVLAKYDANDLIKMCPELVHIANIKTVALMSKMSEDFTSEDWKTFATEIKKYIDDESISGVVFTQGTDTMHFTTAALSFMLQDLNKPVIVTGAQRSVDRGSSDAFMNLVCAVNAAANFEGAGVFLCMHANTNDDCCFLHLGTKVRKMHTLRRDAFRSINAKPVAKVYPQNDKIENLSDKYMKRPESCDGGNDIEKVEPKLLAFFEEKTALIYVYPGMDVNVLDYYFGSDSAITKSENKKFKGIVIAATALGHVPHVMIPKLKKIIESGVPVVICSQTLYGRVDPLVYGPLRELSIDAGCIFAEDIMPEVCYVKLGWILGKLLTEDKKIDLKKVAKMMHTNYAFEIDKRQDPSLFLN
jgi:glutamyl-tRNA(Gln) amidotransferase subunit D